MDENRVIEINRHKAIQKALWHEDHGGLLEDAVSLECIKIPVINTYGHVCSRFTQEACKDRETGLYLDPTTNMLVISAPIPDQLTEAILQAIETCSDSNKHSLFDTLKDKVLRCHHTGKPLGSSTVVGQNGHVYQDELTCQEAGVTCYAPHYLARQVAEHLDAIALKFDDHPNETFLPAAEARKKGCSRGIRLGMQMGQMVCFLLKDSDMDKKQAEIQGGKGIVWIELNKQGLVLHFPVESKRYAERFFLVLQGYGYASSGYSGSGVIHMRDGFNYQSSVFIKDLAEVRAFMLNICGFSLNDVFALANLVQLPDLILGYFAQAYSVFDASTLMPLKERLQESLTLVAQAKLRLEGITGGHQQRYKNLDSTLGSFSFLNVVSAGRKLNAVKSLMQTLQACFAMLDSQNSFSDLALDPATAMDFAELLTYFDQALHQKIRFCLEKIQAYLSSPDSDLPALQHGETKVLLSEVLAFLKDFEKRLIKHLPPETPTLKKQ